MGGGRLTKSISLKKIAYTYHSENSDRPLSIGPCDLDIASGDMVFIVDDTGSGKSTLAKILTGLYEPNNGQLSWDGKVVKPETIDQYRSLFAVVCSDFHLLDRRYGVDLSDEHKLCDLLEEMKLDEKVHYRNNRFSTSNLSTGQRKRLAMAVALLEERDVYVFEEWAVDQDPEYRCWFYTEFLTRLNKEGRPSSRSPMTTVVSILPTRSSGWKKAGSARWPVPPRRMPDDTGLSIIRRAFRCRVTSP